MVSRSAELARTRNVCRTRFGVRGICWLGCGGWFLCGRTTSAAIGYLLIRITSLLTSTREGVCRVLGMTWLPLVLGAHTAVQLAAGIALLGWLLLMHAHYPHLPTTLVFSGSATLCHLVAFRERRIALLRTVGMALGIGLAAVFLVQPSRCRRSCRWILTQFSMNHLFFYGESGT